MKLYLYLMIALLSTTSVVPMNNKAYDSDDDYDMKKPHVSLVRHGAKLIDDSFLEFDCAYQMGIDTPVRSAYFATCGSIKFACGLGSLVTGLTIDSSQQTYNYCKNNPKTALAAGITITTLGILYTIS
jgi:hypothetical protein